MKKHWSVLPLSRRILCIVNAIFLPVFLVIYLTYGSGMVFRFNDSLFSAEKVNDEVILFSGEFEGRAAEFTLTSGSSLRYTLDGVEFGPFTLLDDPTAAPPDSDLAESSFFTPIEIREGDEPIFRGGYHNYMAGALMVNEDGTFYPGTTTPDEPDLHLILHFLRLGVIVRHGNWAFFLIATLFVALTLLTGIFKEPFFRAHMPLTKEEKELKEQEKPTRLRLFVIWTGWSILTFGALFFFIGGLLAY